MKFSYQFSNLLGTIYRKGNLLFSPDGNCVISPVGNRISIYDLKNNKASSLPVESRFNFTTIQLSPDGNMLLAVNEEGAAYIISMISRRVVHTYMFRRPIPYMCFSPDGKHFSIAKENNVFIYKTPGNLTGEYNPFVMERVYHGACDDTTCIDWTSDSRVIAVGSKDMTVRLYSLEKLANFKTYVLGSHSDCVVACYFENQSLDMITVARNGVVVLWECSIELDDLRPYDSSQKKKKFGPGDEDEDDIDTRHAEDPTETAKEIGNDGEDDDNDDAKNKDDQDPDKLYYKRLKKYYLFDEMSDKNKRQIVLTDAAYHKSLRVLVTGFSNGAFLIHEMPDVNLIHSLSISEQEITAVSLNNTGDWIALGCSGLGQLLVWEWQSETYVMKQQSHFNNISCLRYSPDGQHIVTGGDDGKVKLWNTSSGFCFVTFTEHTGSISAVEFSRNGKFVLSASFDGTVRAFDLARYRNFRTFTSPRPVQFVCLAIDCSSEFIAAGGQDVFEIYLWSMKIGRLVEILAGHEGPVVSIAFSPALMSTTLASVSWDKTLKVWNAVDTESTNETIQLSSDGLFVTFSPDGEEIAVACLDAHILFFDTKSSVQKGSIEGRNDLGSGRSDTDLISAKKSLQAKAFTCLCYSADGKCILAGGQSKNVCIYHVQESILIKKFEITQNRSFDAVDDFINRRKMTEFGNLALVEEREDAEGGNVAIRLPGVRKGDMASRAFKPEVRVYHLQFSPTGQAWAAATTEGILIYSLDANVVFEPFQLTLGVTPETVREKLSEEKWSEALMGSIKLNEPAIIQEIIEKIDVRNVELTVRSLPHAYMVRVLKYVATMLESSHHIEFYLTWIQSILTAHGPELCGSDTTIMPILLTLQKNITRKYEDLSKICDFNKYTIKFLLNLGKIKESNKLKDELMEIDDVINDENMS
ncbi:hypothetical protein R5R35_001573 [Gryllus longicercus]|uniref:Small-subunit processome Utp12 domain-containing protein n=1 Tax=Gryllus longicercus TaxID=2509291 RepID=A0AAN9W847_9ORTH